MYVTNIVHLVGIKKVSAQKINSPGYFSINQAQSKCGQ